MRIKVEVVTEHETSVVKDLLQKWRHGDRHAQNELLSLVHSELMLLSSSYLSKEVSVSLSSGDLVNEAVVRLMNVDRIDWQDKAHFLALSANTMRRILVDHIRKKRANKREHYPVTLVTNLAEEANDSFDVFSIDQALTRLHEIDEDRAHIVELRFFGGLSVDEIAEVTGTSASSIKRSWRASRAWLLDELDSP